MKNKGSFSASVHPFVFLTGYKRVSLPREQLPKMLDLCRSLGARYWGVEQTEELGILYTSFFGSKKLLAEAKHRGISIDSVEDGGLPGAMIKHRGRLGIPIGLLLASLMIFASGQVIWDIRVDGERGMSEEQVEALLDECGLRVGVRKSSLDIDVLENRVLILSENISWISVNLRGTVANVEIREVDFAPENEELPEASNLVSDGEGVIVRIEEARGNIAVEVGDAVSRGQLLIGGIYGDEENPFKYVSATGKVFAECEESFTVNIPRVYQKKVYSDKKRCEKYLIFFKKEIKFFTNCGNLPPTCDKIEMIEYLRAPNGQELPIGIKTVVYREYEYEKAVRSDGELSALADYQLRAKISAAIPAGEILGIYTHFELSDQGYSLTRRLRCVRNIAIRQRIDVE